MELAQLDSGSLQLDMTMASLEDLISDCLGRFQALAAQKSQTVIGDISREVDPVSMNVSKISRVLDNLVSNALRHTPEDGHIWITAVRRDSSVEISVKDDGPGFNPKDIPRLFEQFYRGEEARSRTTGGAGLGLAIARGIVEAHGGQIWAENVPGAGAKVTFSPFRNNFKIV